MFELQAINQEATVPKDGCVNHQNCREAFDRKIILSNERLKSFFLALFRFHSKKVIHLIDSNLRLVSNRFVDNTGAYLQNLASE